MQIKPIQYDAVVRECNLALDIHPKFSRALFRRARALQALGKLELALRDVQTILQEEPTHQDAIELAKRLRVSIGSQEEAQRDMQGKTSSSANFYAGTSPAALGASVVRGTPSPVVSRGPNLPAKPLVKRKGMKSDQCSSKPFPLDAKQDGVGIVPKQAHCASQPENKEIPTELSCYTVMSKHSALRSFTSDKSEPSQGVFDSNISQKKVTNALKRDFTMCRRLKLVYDHDIRLAYMPIKCNFRELRNIVGKRFPSAKAVLLKYKDSDGDWITITSTEELRLAEAAADAAIVSVKDNSSKTDQTNKLDTVVSEPALLKLQVVEVNNEQEPIIEDEEEDESLDSQALQDIDEIKKETFNNDLKEDDSHMEKVATAIQQASTEKRGGSSESAEDGKEIEIDEWLLDFAHLFRTHIGVDPDAHIDLHELGMEFCSEALEETVTSEEAQPLFESAACKFQEVAALAFFNWGNVHMCAARKRIPLDEGSDKDAFAERLLSVFEWAQSQYKLARMKYEQALNVKPDFYEGVLALVQECFENAKLRWSLAVASKVDLSTWDSSETIALFIEAEEKMKVAVELWEKLEERRLKEISSPPCKRTSGIKVEPCSSRDSGHELSEAETREQLRVMRFQINLFWGNILFEHSQVEYKLGSSSWKDLLDAAVEKFELAGASSADILVVLKNHAANSASPLDLKGSRVIVCGKEDKSKEEVEVAETNVEGVFAVDSVSKIDTTDGEGSGLGSQ
ncbi:hypothetical protein KP509_28G034700 [Ceratopteris richardii]|nr:hypothetical protein KP509_28G034700 [Ceratopteris richardii]